MRHICITYHMHRENEDAETCIVLPMTEEIANDILTNGEDSEHLAQNGKVRHILENLSTIQGYEFEGAYHFEKWEP